MSDIYGGTRDPSVPSHELLLKGQVSLPDDSETEIFDVGELSSRTIEIIQSAYFDLVVNSQTNVDVRLYVDVNGSLTQVGGAQGFSNDATFDFSSFDVAQPVASSRVRMTAQGDKADPATAATIDYTIEHSTAR